MSVRWTFAVALLAQLFLGVACIQIVGLPDVPDLLVTTDAQSVSDAGDPIRPDGRPASSDANVVDGSLAEDGSTLDAGVADADPDVLDCNAPAAASCAGPGATGVSDCGNGSESCCTSCLVSGGETTFRVGTSAAPATVSTFRLDRYEVTVGRFRRFIAARLPPTLYLPPPGSGKHTHLNGGNGLASEFSPGQYEPGWNRSVADLGPPPTAASLGSTTEDTWRSGNDKRPINFVTWSAAYAFCIWDGGFLPSVAEWIYAATGGGEKRRYPWGATDPGENNQYAIFGRKLSDAGNYEQISTVGFAALGAGRFGQMDLAGNLYEWTLDFWNNGYAPSCTDCVSATNFGAYEQRLVRGGDYGTAKGDLVMTPPTFGNGGEDLNQSRSYIGFRCARTP